MSLRQEIAVGPIRAQLLSNHRYSVVVTDRAGGFSTWRDQAITRWREDPTGDSWGAAILLRDADDGMAWQAGSSRFGCEPDRSSVDLDEGRVQFTRDDGSLTTVLEVAVAEEFDAELRCVTLVNHGPVARTLDLTSYAELVLGSAAADASHPAFSKMFVETEWIAHDRILLATRRRRAPDEPSIWAAHLVQLDSEEIAPPDPDTDLFETDRARFLGRGRILRNAQAMQIGAALSNTVGCVLDPIFSQRRRVRVAAGANVRVAFWTVAAESRERVLASCAALREWNIVDSTLESAPQRAASAAAMLGVDPAAAARPAQWIAPLLYADPAWRAPIAELAKGAGGAPTLWAGGISGDRPIVLLRISDEHDLACVADMFVAQRSWQLRGLAVDVVVLFSGASVPSDLQASIAAQKQHLAAPGLSKAEAFLFSTAQVSDALRDGLGRVARIVLDSGDVAAVAGTEGNEVEIRRPPVARIPGAEDPFAHPEDALAFRNGYGGFAIASREYVVRLTDARLTPAPWVNVIANPDFGFMASCEGGGYSWSINSQQNALTPWPNDPVSDNPGDALYLRDEDSGKIWSACALPVRVESAVYTARHGKGYSRFSTDAYGIELDLLQFVPLADSIKLSRLRIRNASGRLRRLSITAYVDWALAPNGVNAAPFVVTSIDAATGALFARNTWRAEFVERVAFLDLGGAQETASGDRAEFIGANGDVGCPSTLANGTILSGRVGAGLDPCAALQTSIELAAGEKTELVCLLGDASSPAQAGALIEKYRAADLDAILRAVVGQWDGLLGTVRVRTPDPTLDLLLNDWLLYQTLSCRVWARTAYYQASGAYGFRDQLQDVMALCVARPGIAREQILRSASRQFVEGDVQHWWLPPSGRGIRTRITDDRIWLVWSTLHYVDVTGDAALLDEAVPFLEGPRLADGEVDRFFEPTQSPQSGSIYEHCARALDASLGLGAHDLPLFGTGDWNDGMNRVGAGGRGESVWLAWFLIASIERFLPFAEARGDNERIARWKDCVSRVTTALADAGWDGDWFRRGYYDDGTPLGSAASNECRIDQIAQSWSLFCAAADRAQGARAMAAVEEHLIWREDRIAPLLTPAFNVTPMDPGYIKGYPPGLRENGGQYTHGATWSIFAFAALGQGDLAAELFSILNPIQHGDNAEAISRYKVEPYVACGDVYSSPPLVGRGGWSWYTGSAAWLYRAGLEAILGFRLRGSELEIDPVLPRDWLGYTLWYHRRDAEDRVTPYEIAVENPHHAGCGVVLAELDGRTLTRVEGSRGARIPMSDDGVPHRIRIVLGAT